MSTGTVDPTDSPIILPRVKRILVSTEAVFDLKDNQWELKSPWSVRFLSPGDEFPYQEEEIWVYTQLVGGLGPVCLGVELRQQQDSVEFSDPDEVTESSVTYRHVGVQVEDNPFPFPPGDNRLTVYETAIRLGNVPFVEEGVYEFRIVAMTDDGLVALNGQVADVTILDPAGRV